MRSPWVSYAIGLLLPLGCTDPIDLEDGTAGTQGSADESVGSMTSPPPTTTSTTSPTTTVTTTPPPPTTTPPTTTPPTTTPPPTATATVTATDPDATDTATTGVPECPGVGGGPLMVGESCMANAECFTGVCTLYTDAPLDPEATCDVPPVDCSMRVTGTTFDIVTQQPVASADVVVASALQAATNPTGATPLASDTSGADGRIDTETVGPPIEPIGLVALVEVPDSWLTATGLAAPGDDGTTYGVANDIHDLWVVSEVAAMAWSNMLALDPMIEPTSLPLGDAGGVVGLVRDETGAPVAGAAVVPTDAGSPSTVRFLNLDGTFNETETSDLGLFVILEPALAETFEVSVGGMPLGVGTAGSASGAIFSLVLTVP